MPEKPVLSREIVRFVKFIISEIKPRPPYFTPFNVITIPIILVGMVILVQRFTQGLGAVTNLSQEFPWGFWIGFDVITGVALAGGAYIITFIVYVMRVEKYHPIANITVLNGFLAYVFYAGALILDLGRPWNIINPIIGNSFGFNSVMFLVAWHFLMYMAAEFIEFSPVVAEWLGWKKVKKWLSAITLGAVIFGITLSTLHQSGLGALFLMAKSKIHPLWYSEFIPILFFVSSVFAGLCMVIMEGTISHRVLKDHIDPDHHASHDEIVIGLAKFASVAIFVYYFFKLLTFLHNKQWTMLDDFWGFWYILEVVGFVLIPGCMLAFGVKNRNINIIRVGSILAVAGIILNRLNISIIAFKWDAAVKYFPSWQEIVVTMMIISLEIWVFRWVVSRMPVMKKRRAQ
ncbi:MAG: polysulfide reductase NrfD [Candidatus Aminicenantes bacterium]|nr:polysulfide reductase NrfD [Candidatus Aminicenantes bacterium]